MFLPLTNVKQRALRERRPLSMHLITPIFPGFAILECQHGDPDHPKYLINCSLCHCSAILKISQSSTHNLLNNDLVSDWKVSMVIWITTKI